MLKSSLITITICHFMTRIDIGRILISCSLIDISPLLLCREMNREVYQTRHCAITTNDVFGSFFDGL